MRPDVHLQNQVRHPWPLLETVVIVLIGSVLAVSGNGCSTSHSNSTPAPAQRDDVVGGALDTPKIFMVGGSIKRVDLAARTFTVATPMNLVEEIRFDDATAVRGAKAFHDWADVKPGTEVKIDYEMQGDGQVLARAVTIGQSVKLCPCGYDCRCPPSRGCRVFRK
jgi:hypothetical protein